MNERPDPAEVIARYIGRPVESHADALVVTDSLLAALKDAGFMLVHESDRERLVEAVEKRIYDDIRPGTHAVQAVAAIFDALKVGM